MTLIRICAYLKTQMPANKTSKLQIFALADFKKKTGNLWLKATKLALFVITGLFRKKNNEMARVLYDRVAKYNGFIRYDGSISRQSI